MSRTLLPVFAVLACVFPAFAADEAYTLQLYKQKEGDVLKRTITVTTDTKTTTTVDGKSETSSNKAGYHYIETFEVLKYPVDAKHPIWWKRTFEKCDQTDAAGKTTANALNEKTIVSEFADGKVTHTADGKPATDEQTALLEGNYALNGNSPGAFSEWYLPTKPVKVGDTWDVDLKKLQEMDPTKGALVDLKKFSITGKLVKTAKKDGALWGTVEVDQRFVMPPPAADDKNASAQAEGEMTTNLVIHVCLDGTVPGERSEGKIGVNFTVKSPGDVKKTISSTATMKITTEPVTKK